MQSRERDRVHRFADPVEQRRHRAAVQMRGERAGGADERAAHDIERPMHADIHAPPPDHRRDDGERGARRARRARDQQARRHAADERRVITRERAVRRVRNQLRADAEHERARRIPEVADHLRERERDARADARFDRLAARRARAHHPGQQQQCGHRIDKPVGGEHAEANGAERRRGTRIERGEDGEIEVLHGAETIANRTMPGHRSARC